MIQYGRVPSVGSGNVRLIPMTRIIKHKVIPELFAVSHNARSMASSCDLNTGRRSCGNIWSCMLSTDGCSVTSDLLPGDAVSSFGLVLTDQTCFCCSFSPVLQVLVVSL